jgi:glycosyl hydrolase family 28
MAVSARRSAVAEVPRVLEVTSFGAVPDGRTLCTAGLQRAVDACAAAGGGTVVVPAGRYLTGAVFLRSHVHLHLSAGATLAASGRTEDFPPIKGREEGVERQVHASLLTGLDLEDVSITGRGLLDGQGEPWWKADEAVRKMQLERKLPREAEYPAGAPLRWPRPRMINLVRCRDVLIDGLTVMDGPGVNVHLLYCQEVMVSRLTIFQNKPVRSSEAIIVDSSRGVTISDCRLSSGADGIGIKSGYNEDGRRVGLPSENVLITNCHLVRVSSGVVIGSETAGGIRNVVVSHCVIRNCFSGVRIRSPRGRGGVVEKIRVSDVLIDGTEDVAIKLSNFFDSLRSEGRFVRPDPARQNLELARSRKAPVDEGTPTFRDFSFSGLTLGMVKEVALVEGLPERYMERVTFEDLVAPHARSGIACTLATAVRISNFETGALETPAVDAREIEHLEIHRLRCARPPADAPLVFLEEVGRAFIHGCYAGKSTARWVEHERCRQVHLDANSVG